MKIIRIIKACILCILIVFLGMQLYQRPNSKADFETVVQATLKDLDISELEQKDNLAIKRFLSINPDDYENIVFYANTDNMKASEIVIVKFKSNDQSHGFRVAMEARIKNQKNIFDGYIEEQASLVKKAEIDVCANYAVYVVSPNASAFVNQFEKAL